MKKVNKNDARWRCCHVWTAPVLQAQSLMDFDLTGCGHVSGLLARRVRPLALMKSASRVPFSLSDLMS
jgi:hypothetical protein